MANSIVGIASVGLRVQTKDFNKGLKQAQKAFQNFQASFSKMKGSTEFQSAMRNAISSIGHFKRAVKNLSKNDLKVSFTNMAKSAKGFGKSLATTFKSNSFKAGLMNLKNALGSFYSWIADIAKKIGLALVGIGTAFVGLSKKAINEAANMETILLSFQKTLGKEKGTAFVDWMRQFALKTPFEFEGLLQASKTLLNFGMTTDQVKASLERIGDAAAQTGNFNSVNDIAYVLGKTMAQGKIYTRDILMLVNKGLPAWDMLAEGLGTNVAGAMEQVRKGAVDSNTAVTALLKGFERYDGQMNSIAGTTQGRLSTMQDEWQNLLITFGNTLLPQFKQVIDWVTAALSVVSDYIQNNQGNITNFISNIANKMKPFLVQVASIGVYLYQNFKKIIPLIQTVYKVITSIYDFIIWIIAGTQKVGLEISKALSMVYDKRARQNRNSQDYKDWKQEWDDIINENDNKWINRLVDTDLADFGKIQNDMFTNPDSMFNEAFKAFDNFNSKVQEKMRQNQQDLTSQASKTPLPDFGNATNTLKQQQEMFKQLEEQRKKYMDGIARMGAEAYSSMLIPNWGAKANELIYGSTSSEESLSTTNQWLELIAEKVGVITEDTMVSGVDTIPLGGY